jgi:hypothetical protein
VATVVADDDSAWKGQGFTESGLVPSFGAKEAVTKKPGLAGCYFHGVVAASQLGGHLPVPSFGKFHTAARGHFFMLGWTRTWCSMKVVMMLAGGNERAERLTNKARKMKLTFKIAKIHPHESMDMSVESTATADSKGS